MKNSTLFSVETRFKDRFYCCLESLKGNYKFLLIFAMFMGSFMQGVSAQGTLVPSCNLIGPLEACAVVNPADPSGDIMINIEVARSGVPNLTDATHNANFVYSFPTNSSGAFIRSYGPVTYFPATNRTTQTLMVCPGTGTPEFNLQLNATNTTSTPNTVCECSKSVSVSKVAVTSSFSPILCYGQTSTLTAVGQFSDVNQYTYTLVPGLVTNTTGIFENLPGTEAGIEYTVTCVSAEGCVATTSQIITQPAFNPVVLSCPEPVTVSACASPEVINAAFNAWLNSFSYTGGTNPHLTRVPAQPTVPALCGGSREVTWTVTDTCGQPQSCTRIFTITPAPAVIVAQPQNSTTNACSYENQDAANAAFAAWLAQFTVSGGCTPTGNYGQPTAPAYCGGTRTVIYTVTDRCYATSTHTATFTITPAPEVVITQAQNSITNACSYANQAAADSAFAAWLRGFTVTGGCAPIGSFGEGTPTAPAYCGGQTTVIYTITDRCFQTTPRTATFTITPAPAVVPSIPANSTSGACSYADQAAADAAYQAWLNSFSVSGGCAPVGAFTDDQSNPSYCGGSRTVTYVIADKCFQGASFTRTFTITPAPAVVVTGAQDATSNACSYANQAAANAAFATWLQGFSVTGGCAPVGSFGEGTPSAPAYCGGATTVTYRVSDKCYEGSSVSATFTITPAPLVVANIPASVSSNACSYADQAAADAAYQAWLNSFTVSGGCAPVGAFTSEQTAPAYCGGTRTVVYVVTDKCYQTATYERTFTITAAPDVVVNGPQSTSSNACTYANQAAADAAFATWLQGFSVTGGCAPFGTYGEPTAPAYCGGTTSVTYRVSDKCYNGASITRTFVITPAADVITNIPANSSSNACSYADQAAADAAYQAWLDSFSVSGGCAPVGAFTSEQSAPAYCGGTRTVVYVVTDKCYQTTRYERTFTITSAPAVVATAAQNATSNACTYADQAAADAAFTAWLQGFSVTGGCAPVGSFGEGTPSAPAYCGGATTVTYRVSDKCYDGSSVSATFTITPAPEVVANIPANSSSNACSYADQAAADAAYQAWLNSFTVSGGCAPVGAFTSEQTAPAYCGGTRTVVYVVTDKCYQTTRYERTFTITSAPAVVLTAAQDATSAACSYADQAAADAAFAAWLQGFAVSGGCTPTGSYGQPVAPPHCGGTVTVTYRASDRCYNGGSVSATFTITPAPQVVVNTPANSTTPASAYADQAAADAAFAAWLTQFSVTGGCAPTGSYGEPTAPYYCGGSREVTYTVTDRCYETTTHTATFTITPATAPVVNGPESTSTNACSYADQAAADAAFAAWLAQFTVSGGLNPQGSFGEGTPAAPQYCGGTTTVTYTVTDRCFEPIVITRTFVITPAPQVVVNGPENNTSNACSYADQAAADAAFAAWIDDFSVTGGCAPIGVLGVVGAQGGTTPAAPAYCGGTITVSYSVVDKCYQGAFIVRTFTITPAPQVVVNSPANSTSNACTYADQAAADAAFASWLQGFSVTGGCAPVGSFGEGQLSAPAYCGGTVTVTYSVSDKCYEGSRRSATFTITPAPAVTVNADNATVNACSYADQAALNTAFTAWLNSFTVSGGCTPTISVQGQPVAPSVCGGSVCVTILVTDRCYQGSTITKTFTVTPAPAVVITAAENATSAACSYANQAAADTAFAAWLNGFSVTGGCTPRGSFGEGIPSAPAYCGGTTSVTYTVTDRCYETQTRTATFTITPAPALVITAAQNSSTAACSYANQAAADAAFTAWLNGFSVSGGCAPSGSFGQPVAPAYCGGTTTVTYTATDRCAETTTRTATFTITPAPALVITAAQNSSTAACSYANQAAANAAFTAWLNGFSVSGGCAPVGSFGGTPSAPAYCGGTTTVTYTATDRCAETTTRTATFTITPAPAVVFNCGSDVTVPACSTQAQVNAAWTAFLNSTSATGGCNGSLTRTTASAPSICGGSASITWTYTSGCNETRTCTRTFTVAAPAPAVITCASNVTLPACSTQAQVNAAWTAFLNSATATGGCGGVLTRTSCSAPSLCGGYVDVTWTYTVANCGQQSGCGNTNAIHCTKRFTVAAPAPVVFNCGNNVTLPACSTQAQLNAAWTSFLNSTTASGGCGGVLTNNGTSAPSLCGGYKDVTWTYTVASCGQQSGCGSSNTVTCTKRFTVQAPSQVVFNCGSNVTVGACKTQAQVNSAWTAFLNSTTASGGCGGVLTNNAPAQAPSACGGSVNVTWTYTVASCGQQSGCGNTNTMTCTRTFTVTPTQAVVFNCGNNVTVPACSTQTQVNTAWNAFLASTTASGGCNGVFSRTSATTPSSCGGSVDVTWTYTTTACGGQSSTQTCTKTFTVAAPAPVVLTPGANVTLPACSTQAQLNTAWTAFLNSTTGTGGCDGRLTRTSCSAPSLCGGYVDVTWTYTVDTCGQSSGCGNSNSGTQSQSITRRFTVATPSPLTFNAGNNVTVPACSTQAQLNAAWTSFLNSTTVTGGCNATLTRTSCNAPSLCGGYVDVTWTATTASCGQQSGCGSGNSQSITRRFTVSAPTQVSFNCGSNVTLSGSSTQAQITAAWNAFLNSTTASGGCGAVLTRTSASMPTECGEYADVTWTYTVASCGAQSGCGNSNSLTCTKRFSISGSSATVNAGANVTLASCKTQAQVNAAWTTFINSTTVTGGSGTLTNNASSCTIPSACGGYADVTWTYRSNCGQATVTCGGQTTTASTYTVTRRFTVQSGGAVNVSGPSNATYSNNQFSSQYALNNAFAAWLCQFTTVSNGCGSTAVFSGDTRVAPSLSSGGSVRVTYSITGNCNSDSVCATFTVTRGSACKIEAPASPMTAKAYPNPFSETFNIDLATTSPEKVGVAIYDMTGKLIEQREVNAIEVSELQIGDRFASGVYNVIVTQGNEVKTLRVIKR